MSRAFTEIPLTPLRKAISARMTQAKQTIPHFRLVANLEIDALLRWRATINEVNPTKKISVNDCFIKAVAGARRVTSDSTNTRQRGKKQGGLMHKVMVNGAAIPVIGLGTWTLKGEVCSELVANALSLGYRHVDTAAYYENEKEVGDGLRSSGVALDEVFVTTKVWHSDIAPGDLERSAEASLKRLGLDTVDLLLIHWPNPAIPLAGSIKALNAVRDSGMARHIGVSNFPTAMLAEAVHLSDAPLVANQVEYHPFLDQTKVHAACRAAGIAMVAYAPLGRGEALFEQAAIRDAAKRHGKTPPQIVLRWHVQQEGVVAIPRTKRNEKLAENVDLFDFELSGGEMTAISRLRSRNLRIYDRDRSPQWDEG